MNPIAECNYNEMCPFIMQSLSVLHAKGRYYEVKSISEESFFKIQSFLMKFSMLPSARNIYS